ncbi:MAG: replication-associated recombination protein A [Patescibacteria group bacterium]|nr:replication-associated recombination protein A [Patescibacteria group bacterium]
MKNGIFRQHNLAAVVFFRRVVLNKDKVINFLYMEQLDVTPLADRMRPGRLAHFYGQEELIGKNSFLRQAIEADSIPSMVLWGPPGSGKTTLAHIITKKTDSEFVQLSAVTSGKRDLVQTVAKAIEIKKIGKRTILFIDEIHRWNKAQQDTLLPYVEKGIITFIGATTENPSFEVISALISRSRVFILKKLSRADIAQILKRAIKILEKNGEEIKTENDALAFIANLSNGDARMALNTLEACVNQKTVITADLVKNVLQKAHLFYDKTGEEHYNIISALHKSMRGGDANAALYWLARMLEGGEDPVYIARRLMRFAAEDVGLADNHALVLANAVFDACRKLGMPECNVHLAQCVIYLSKTKKSILVYEAYNKAKKDVEKYGNLDVPLPIRNAPTRLMKDLSYGKDYKYTPKEDSSDQEYLPDEIKDRKYI